MLTDVNEILELNIKNRSVCMAYCKLQVGTGNSCVKLAIAVHVVLLSVAIYHFFVFNIYFWIEAKMQCSCLSKQMRYWNRIINLTIGK